MTKEKKVVEKDTDMQEEVVEVKPKKKQGEKKKSSIVGKVFSVIFWIAFAIVLAIWLTDFFKVQNEKDPIFCLSEKTHQFDDGTVYECTGLGYKIYKYNRSSMAEAIQFSPFFVKMKEPK